MCDIFTERHQRGIYSSAKTGLIRFERAAIWLMLACFCVPTALALSSYAQAQIPGAVDSTFGLAGTVALHYPGASSAARAVVIQSDGKILIAGTCDAGANPDFCLARLNADGTLDPTFDGPDSTGTGVGAGRGIFKFLISFTADAALAIALQADGKIVVAGTCNDDDNPGSSSFCLARLNVNGTFDSAFNGPGAGGVGVGTAGGRFVMSLFIGSDAAAAVAVQPADGKIVVSGSCRNTLNNWDFCAARLNPSDGSFDSSFGPNGGVVSVTVGGGNDEASSMALQSDGKILLVGKCRDVSTGLDSMCAARLLSTGALDSGFNGPAGSGNGRVFIPVGTGRSVATAVALQSNGRIVIGGSCGDSAAGSVPQFCVARLLAADGKFDNSFNGSGSAGIGRFSFSVGGLNDQISSVKIDADGKALLTGQCQVASRIEFCFARLLEDGSFDAAFDGSSPSGHGNGRFSLALLGTLDFAYATTIAADGKLVVVGACFNAGDARYDLCATRLHGSAGLAPNLLLACGLDLDGNLSVLAASDGTLLLRWLLGFRGDALTSGALAFGATRDAAAINVYALTQLSRWNVDGDVSTTALTDGLMLLRAMLGLRNLAITSGALGMAGTRASPALVQAYLDAGCS